ncbi:aminotransferase class IV [Pontibacter akesuensis]|uniref:branched-chain-amino-acid transaminase n=1 Tax=Pontibacter akesuensis TaxID=388950 RepID=A0A1I7J344_9BACT|nr:aminotransferase class IV [Pontibacter akesuensis]GHA72710.1 D-amino-acid transaminase [Pontibacter akesuensis]SFU79570.1 branched-chain amino acid aminotransferase [Pontibacter akesuensis]
MPSTAKLHAYIHGQIQPLESAFLHVSDLSIQRGYGIFDYFKVQQGRPVFLADYLSRFYKSAQLMELRVPLSINELEDVLQELIVVNNLPLSGVKMILTGGYSANGYDPGEPNLIILQQPLTLPTQEMINQGIKIITHEFVREIPRAKTINYSTGIRLIKQIQAAGAADVLYHQNGVVTEFPRCNFFIVTMDDVVVTPAEDVLLGVTRKNVLEIARHKYKTEERAVTLEDIAQAKEAFLTSTTKRILPIVQVDDQAVSDGKPGTVTRELLQELIALENKLALQV